MVDINRSIQALNVKAVRDYFKHEGNQQTQTQTQSCLFQHLVASLKEKPRAAHAGAGKQLVYLLSLHEVDINLRTDTGNTPLQDYLECPDVHPAVAEAFLRCNADAYAPNKNGRTPFALAYFNPRLSKNLKNLFMQYVPGLWRAVESDDVMNVRKLVNQWCRTTLVKEGKSLIQLARETGSEGVTRVVRDIRSSMDLAHAVLATDIHRATEILASEEKVNVNFHNMGDGGATPLYFAILNNDIEMVDLLLDNGARAEISMTQGEHDIPLFMSVLSEDLDIEEKTLCRVVDRLSRNSINNMFFLGSNVLLHCINNNVPPSVVELILRKGGAVLATFRDQDNLTAREIAELHEKTNYVDLINQVVSDWVFYPGAEDSNRKLLCLHAYPGMPRVPMVPGQNLGSGDFPEVCNSIPDVDDFWQQLKEYLHDVDQFHTAVESGDLESVNQLIYLDKYSQYFEPCLADSRKKANFQPALHKAVLRVDKEITKVLVEASIFLLGYRLDCLRDQCHRTALYYAMATEGAEDLVFYLTESGASGHVMDKDGRSPQLFKDRKGEPVMKQLLQYYLAQDYTLNEPDPWSTPLPVPIVRYIKKYAEDHKHGHGLPHHHHHHHQHHHQHHHHHAKALGTGVGMAIQSRAYTKSESDSGDSQNGDAEGSETESNQGTSFNNRQDSSDESDSKLVEEQSARCCIL